jgi:hypothetical protein
MALRPAPKRHPVDYRKVDDLQEEIFGLEREPEKTASQTKSKDEVLMQLNSDTKTRDKDSVDQSSLGRKNSNSLLLKEKADENFLSSNSKPGRYELDSDRANLPEKNLRDLETIAANIVSTKAGQGRHTTRPYSLPRTLIIDTTRLKSKFRTVDEQFTQNVIIDYLLREALAVITPENYKNLKESSFEFIKRPDETTRRSLTVTEEVVYQMSELKAGINLETGRKYSNDEILSTLLAFGVSWLYRNKVLS